MTKKEKEEFSKLRELYEEDFKLLKETCEKYDALKGELCGKKNEILGLKSEVSSLKQTIGGYITCVGKQKKEISELKGKCEILKKYNEDKYTQICDLEAKNKDLIKKVGALNDNCREYMTERDEAKRVSNFYKANYEHFLSLPWYKRIFAK